MTTREEESLSARWEAYQRADRLTNHWYWRPGWRPARTFYTWHLTFKNQPDLHRLVAEIQSGLPTEALDLVPLSGLHLTVQGLGFADEVSGEDITHIVEAARDRCAQLPSFEINLGPVDPDAEGIGLLVRPWDKLTQLRTAIRDAIASVWSRVPEDVEFRPHITVAYSGANAPSGEIVASLRPLRRLRPVSLQVEAVELIELRRNDREYVWDTVDAIHLCGSLSR
ncbi:2'-5' RNA ligase family protein [Asanoa ishikariensis]|uniref:2'-5' RNA ligase family protein n=1 Tax=Asanoa ishikariensis TaxID=137265 RepID=UPI000B88752E|nr:2'-5' RNA ligase family protein [Asanoa ishikariensis]